MQMEQIEKATGKKIIRIETNDLDQMEEVTCLPSIYVSFSDASHMLLTDDEEGLEIIVTRRISCTVDPSQHNPVTDLVMKMLGMDIFRLTESSTAHEHVKQMVEPFLMQTYKASK
jgi:hypothetical protein